MNYFFTYLGRRTTGVFLKIASITFFGSFLLVIAYPVQASTVSSFETAVGHGCALLDNGTVWCVGSNDDGQLGNGTINDVGTFIPVGSIISATKVVTGLMFTCALLESGEVQCWGNNRYGRLGDGSKTDSYYPVKVKAIDSAVAISAGAFHVCAILENGSVRCWGNNKYGQVGNGERTDSPKPILVKGIRSAEEIAMQIKVALLNHLPDIIRESVKPMERIDGIKIMHVDGLGLGNGNGVAPDGSGGGEQGSLADQIVNSALRYRGQAPLLDALLQEVGIQGGNINAYTSAFQKSSMPQPSEAPSCQGEEPNSLEINDKE